MAGEEEAGAGVGIKSGRRRRVPCCADVSQASSVFPHARNAVSPAVRASWARERARSPRDSALARRHTLFWRRKGGPAHQRRCPGPCGRVRVAVCGEDGSRERGVAVIGRGERSRALPWRGEGAGGPAGGVACDGAAAGPCLPVLLCRVVLYWVESEGQEAATPKKHCCTLSLEGVLCRAVCPAMHYTSTDSPNTVSNSRASEDA
jgi:hypothetical protein